MSALLRTLRAKLAETALRSQTATAMARKRPSGAGEGELAASCPIRRPGSGSGHTRSTIYSSRSAPTNAYRATRALFVAQRFARQASPITTLIYTHPSDEELYAGIRDLPC